MIHLFILLMSFMPVGEPRSCTGSGIFALGEGIIMSKNGHVVFEFFAQSQEHVKELNKGFEVYLQSKKHKVGLKPVEILEGEFLYTQVVFKPTSELKLNETYDLVINNEGRESRLTRYNRKKNQSKTISYRIIESDHEPPVLITAFAEKEKKLIHYGCGPEKWVSFSVAAKDNSEVFVRATVESLAAKKTTSYILPIEEGTVTVGHGMCGGAFKFESGDNYKVTFTLWDNSGNTSAPSKPIRFTTPKSKY